MTLLERMMQLDDPRQSAKCSHDLGEVIFMTTCAILCGADDWEAITLFAETRKAWFKQYLKLSGGIPSHDTFNRLFSLLDPVCYREMFCSWVQDVLVDTPLSGVVAIDGKTVRASRSKHQQAIHMVNAWASDIGVSLGQYKVDNKSNEIKAIPKLLEQLTIKGCLVTMDAMGCQKKIVSTIVKQESDYLVTVKSNQKTLHKTVSEHFDCYWVNTPEDTENDGFFEQHDQKHGREEHRRCWATTDLESLSIAADWHAKTIAAIQSDRQSNGKGRTHIRYFISSKIMTAEDVLKATRQHWYVENQLHWVLDVSFGEDQCRARNGYAAENLATTRQIALNLLKQETSIKVGIKNKRKACGWDEKYLFKVMGLIK
ncbi:ISAs1 family transposase [Marinomonas primoryensis]|jgi:predicted transposase YbfD/YdcC|uniref:ISAs1 family transposase n=1 Tax=Marinomonas primoryensis TaxID=178399 RepID=UPI0037048D55